MSETEEKLARLSWNRLTQKVTVRGYYIPDRRWFYPALIHNRGKHSLPFTGKEQDFIPSTETLRRKEDNIPQRRTRKEKP